jgi:hypothetical protein
MTHTPFREVWLVDFEFSVQTGERPSPVCLAAREFHSGQLVRRWLWDAKPPVTPPFAVGPDVLLVAYYASAELGCYLALGWPFPVRILDLSAEFRCSTSGLTIPNGKALLGAMAYYGLDTISAAEKEEMRLLALRGGTYTESEKVSLIDYCQTDVDALAKLLPAMLPKIDLPRALLHGRYMAAAARMEWAGVPIDTDTLGRLRVEWDSIKTRLVAEVDRDFGVYVPDPKGGPPSFSADRFGAYLERVGIAWPRLDSGRLALDDDTFKEAARAHPQKIGPLRELRHTLSQLKLNKLAVGPSGRNRCLLGAFGSRTGRNQPSNSKFIFGPSTWLRSLITPAPGMAVAYIDWTAQELGIAAALSGDAGMQEAYRSGDPYLWFASRVGEVPAGATKLSHQVERDQFKVVSLGVLYGLSDLGLSRKLSLPPCRGRELLQLHRETFPRFWAWSDAIENQGLLSGELQTVFGWRVHVGQGGNPRSLRNFPMQGNGAEMLRLACCLATERGISVCCPVHDALLIESTIAEIEEAVNLTRSAMAEASRVVLAGFELATEAKVVRYPDRYSDPRGVRMWETVNRLLDEGGCRNDDAD